MKYLLLFIRGIMNGIDAVAIATGQDWRALEAAAHSYAY
jgi:hydroxymethylglutaryl-CoA reductase